MKVYTPQTKFGREYVGITLSVPPSIHLFVRPSVFAIVSIHIFLVEKHWRFLLHTKITYDIRMCHDFIPMSFELVQCQWKEKCKIRVRSVSFSWRNIESSYFMQK